VLHTFAVTPDAFDPASLDGQPAAARALPSILRDIDRFGVLANMDRGRWLDHVRTTRLDRLADLNLGIDLLLLLEQLHKHNRLIRFPKRLSGPAAADEDWIELAETYHREMPFDAIVVGDALFGRRGPGVMPMVPVSGAPESSQWSACLSSRAVEQIEAPMRSALGPLLAYAGKATLIDQYLSPKPNFRRTVSICAEVLGRAGRRVVPGRLNIHAADPRDMKGEDYDSVEARLDAWLKLLSGLVRAHPHRYRVFLWSEALDGRRMHARYIFTDQCGVSVLDGLDCFNTAPARSSDWSLLDRPVWEKRAEDYDEATSHFRLCGQLEVDRGGYLMRIRQRDGSFAETSRPLPA
jgi:hypothetical protein